MNQNTKKHGGFFDPEGKQKQLYELEHQINAQPDFWLDQTKSAPILKQKKAIENSLATAAKLKQLYDDSHAALDLAIEGTADYLEEAKNLTESLEDIIKQIQIENILNQPQDKSYALITLNAGAGGTESCDWASMLLRMYLRHAEKKGWPTEIIDIANGDEAGIKSASVEISGEYAYGLLKSESGVHRLVRISPFDSNARRHTSFCSVFVTPIIDDEIEVIINPADLKIDTYRASGAGGQHVNKTDSAVRITHIPTGTIVQCQNQRSQHQNKDKALKILKSKLYELELQKRESALKKQEESKSDISFGHQIRSYVLHPYKLAKDHRTNLESHSPLDVLDGYLDDFVQAYLLQNATK